MADTEPQPKHVLILYSFENEVGLYSDFDDSLRATLRSGGAGHIEFYTEFLDLARFPNPQHEKELQDILRAKYSSEKIDLIFPVSLPAINFILSQGAELFPGVPTVFCAVDRRWVVRIPLAANTTGIVETTKISKTLAGALQLQPDARRVVVVGGTLPYERDWMREIQGDLREYERKLDFTYLTDLPMDELLRRLANLPDHTIILYMMMWRDGAGENFLPKEVLLRMVQASNAPIYGVFESFLGSGMVGGDLIPLEKAGIVAAEMGLHVLKGEKPADIPVLSEDNATYSFDWRQLRRWQISEKRLPPGSKVLFRRASLWELYRSRIIVVSLLIVAETMLIAFLLIERRERKLAESSLFNSEARYRSLVESSHDWVWEVDADGVYTYAGPQCRHLLGYEPNELIGKRPFDLMLPEEAQRVRLALAEIAGRHRPFRGLETTNLHKDGRSVVLETNGVPRFDEQSRFCGYRGMDRDITKRNQSEDKLRKSEKKYRQLHESMIDGFVRRDMEGRITEFNDAFQKLVGYEPEELLKLTHIDLTPAEWHAFEASIVKRQVLVQGHSDVYQKEYKRKDGTIIPVELRTHLMRDETGTPSGVWAIVRDISERKQAEKALQEYEKVVESSGDMIVVLDREYRYLIANRVYLEHFALERGQVVGHSVSEVMGEEFFEGVVKKRLDECFAGKAVRYETKHQAARLGERTLFASYFPIESSEGINEACCVIQDITERRQAEEALQESQRQLSLVYNNVSDSIFYVAVESDDRYRFLSVNPAFLKATGLTEDQVVGELVEEVIPKPSLTVVLGKYEEAIGDKQTVRWEETSEYPAGIKVGEVAVAPVFDETGRCTHLIGAVHDLTDRKRSEKALGRQAAFNELMIRVLSCFATCSPSEVDASVEEALQSIGEFVGADHAYVVRFSPDLTTWSGTHEWCGPSLKPLIHEYQHVPMGRVPRTECRLLAGESVRINSPDDYPPDAVAERRHREAEGHLAALDVPIRTRAGILGSIGLHSHEQPVVWSDDDVARLQMVGEAVAAALERKESLEVLRRSEEKFSKAFHASPVAMTILSLSTGRYIEVNKAFEDSTGFQAEEIIGHTPKELGIYVSPADSEEISDVVTEPEPLRNLETQYRTKSGDLRVALLSTEIIDFGGVACVLRVIEDITDRKRIEKALRGLGGRMLMVQEEERRRVARELHDDFSQRLALLAIDLEQLSQRPPAAKEEWTARLEAMRSQTQDLTSDLHRLSYQLHPSKLEDLGLVVALRSYCHGLSRQARLEVKFSDKDVPRVLPKEVSLCIYRIVQESLHNVVKHSGVNAAVVELSGGPNEVRLVVSDLGKGFAPEAARGADGLGLANMQERVRYVGGTFSIDARPSGGTRIVARIPVPSQQAQAYPAAG